MFGKLLVGAVALFAIYRASVDTMAIALADADPHLVQKIAPGDPETLSRVVDIRTLGKQKLTAPTKAEAARLREALKTEPLSGSILRQLAMADQLEGRSDYAAHLLDLSHRISRRYLITELLLAQLAARANRPAESLSHFDAALSSNSKAAALMFPPLAKTLADPSFRPYVAQHLARRWAPEFLDLAVRVTDPLAVMATVTKNPAVQREERFRRFRGDLMTRLVNEGHAADAFQYAALAPKHESAPIAVIAFTRASTDPGLGPLLWRLSNTNGIYSALSGDRIVTDIDPASTGAALERIFALKRGTYTIAATTKAADQSQELSGDWSVVCLTGGGEARELGKTAAPLGPEEKPARLRVTVDRGCEAVQVALQLRNLDDQRDAEIEISRFSLTRSDT